MAFDQRASKDSVERAMAALKESGIESVFVQTGEDAKKKVLEMIPAGAEVMNMTSMTLEGMSVATEVAESGKYNSVRAHLNSLDRTTQGAEMQRIGAAHEWVLGSVHAVTEDGKVLVASATGSQLGSYAYGAAHVVWVVGAQKIVKDFDEGMRRLYEHALPLEDARARTVYGMGSGVNKILVMNKEVQQGRITMIIVNEILGF